MLTLRPVDYNTSFVLFENQISPVWRPFNVLHRYAVVRFSAFQRTYDEIITRRRSGFSLENREHDNDRGIQFVGRRVDHCASKWDEQDEYNNMFDFYCRLPSTITREDLSTDGGVLHLIRTLRNTRWQREFFIRDFCTLQITRRVRYHMTRFIQTRFTVSVKRTQSGRLYAKRTLGISCSIPLHIVILAPPPIVLRYRRHCSHAALRTHDTQYN